MNVLREYEDVAIAKLLKEIFDSYVSSNNATFSNNEFRKSKANLMNSFNIDYFNYFKKNDITTAIIIKRKNSQIIYLYDNITKTLTRQ